MEKIKHSEQEWQQRLDPEVYRIARGQGTERAFSGRYWNHHADGLYACACCGLPLFDATAKYDSGSGWPSFWQPVQAEHVAERTDCSHGMQRTEVCCARCDAHLGHVFADGPPPTGLRYCINSASLQFGGRP